jgi:hypothetical protein
MIRHLINGHETVARTARGGFSIADAANVQPTCDLLHNGCKYTKGSPGCSVAFLCKESCLKCA